MCLSLQNISVVLDYQDSGACLVSLKGSRLVAKALMTWNWNWNQVLGFSRTRSSFLVLFMGGNTWDTCFFEKKDYNRGLIDCWFLHRLVRTGLKSGLIFTTGIQTRTRIFVFGELDLEWELVFSEGPDLNLIHCSIYVCNWNWNWNCSNLIWTAQHGIGPVKLYMIEWSPQGPVEENEFFWLAHMIAFE
jgi:hypothetical protein